MTVSRLRRRRCLEAFGFLSHLIDIADEVERPLGQIVVTALQNLLEAGQGLLELHVSAGQVGEHLRHEERLAQEHLDKLVGT